MKHLLHKLSSLRLLMLLAVLLGMGGAVWAQSDYSAVYTSNVTLSTSGGTSASTAAVIVTGTTQYDAIKVGTGKIAGALKMTVPSGTKYLHLHIVAWNNETVNVSISPKDNLAEAESSLALTADAGVSGSVTTFTLNAPSNATTNYYKVLTFNSALTDDTVFTFTATGGKRFVLWGVNSEEEGSGTEKDASDLALTGAIALNFDLYNNSSAQKVNFTTSSTGEVTIADNDYATFAIDKDNKTITVTPTAVTPSTQTITVNQAEDETYKAGSATFTLTITDSTPIPTYTVTLGDDNSTLTEISGGAGVTLPIRSNIDSYTFEGWSETNVAEETTTAPIIIPAGSYNPTGDITLYPVYAVTEGGGGVPSAFKVGDTGNFAIVSAEQGGKYYALPTNPTVNNGKITAQEIIVSETDGLKYVTITDAGGFTWTIASATNGYTLSDGSSYIYHSNGGSSGTNLAYGNSTSYTWALTEDGDYVKMAGMSGKTTNNRGMLFSGTTIGGYALSNSTLSGYYRIMILPIANAGTTYYWSNPVAATVAKPVIAVEENPFLFSTTATITCETEGAAIKYSFDGETWNDYTEELTITETTTIYAKAVKNEDVSEVASVTATKNLAAPTVTINADGITNTNVFDGAVAGSLVATVTYNDAAVEGAIVTWSGDNDEVATIDASTGAVTLVAAGTVTFTATYAGNSDYSEKTATYEMTVTNTDPNAPGTENNPYSVAQAIENTPASGTSENVYITGIVSAFYKTSIMGDGSNYRYYISDDGGTDNQLLVYKGKGLNNVAFSSADDLQLGDVVTIYGGLTTYSNAPEVAANNYIVSLVRKTTPGLEWSEASFTAKKGEENAYPTLTNTNGVTVTYSSTDEAVATIDASTGVITLVANGNTTIKATFAGNEDYLAQEVSYELTVKGFSKDAAGINFIEESYEFVYNDDDYTAFEGQALTNPNNLDVVWSSDDEEVAIVDDTTGEVVLGQPGTATITATFTEDEDYLGSVVSYTITINKAEAGLSFDGTSFMVAPNGDFTEPTFNNPNDLTVEWTSTNEDVAYVYGGEVLIGSKEGTATITASFAGNDYYNAGNASYTITVSNILLQTWDLSTNSYSKASENEVDWTSANVTMIATKYDASTPANNYLGGDANERTSSRFYKNSKLTITPAAGYQISSVEFTATSPSYATALNNSAWTNAKAIVSGTTVTVTPVYGSKAFEAVIGGTCGFTSVTVTYQVQTQETVVIGTAGYTSYTTKFDVNFEGTSVTAYIATAVNSETIHLESVTEAPAGTALILQAAPETYLLNSDCEGTTDLSSNLLLSSDGTVTGDGSTIYALGVGKVAPYEGEVGFYVVNDGQTVPAGKAYLTIAQASSVKEFLTFDFGELPTGLNDVRSKMEDVSGDIFNLAGQKMNRLQKGINIVNGRKVLVK